MGALLLAGAAWQAAGAVGDERGEVPDARPEAAPRRGGDPGGGLGAPLLTRAPCPGQGCRQAGLPQVLGPPK